MQGPDGFGGGVVGLGAVLQETHRFLLPLCIGHKTEAGCLALHFFTTPTLSIKHLISSEASVGARQI